MSDKGQKAKEVPRSPSNENIDDNLSALGTGEDDTSKKVGTEDKTNEKDKEKKVSDDVEEVQVAAPQTEANEEAAGDGEPEGAEGAEGEGGSENTAQRRPSIANLLSTSSVEGAKMAGAGSPRGAPFYPYPYYPFQGFPMPPPEGFPLPIPEGKAGKNDKSKDGAAGDETSEKVEVPPGPFPFYPYYGQPPPYFYPPIIGPDGIPFPFPPRQGMPFYPPGYPVDPNNPNAPPPSGDGEEASSKKPSKEKAAPKKKRDANVAVVSADRPYPCSVEGCRWAFARLSDQRRHLRSHQKPTFHCPYWNSDPTCHRNGGAFNRLDVLKRHLRLVHFVQFKQSESGWCRVCQKMFPTPKHFVEHCEKCAQAARPTEWKIDIGRVMIENGKPGILTVTDDSDLGRNNPTLLSMANVDTELKEQDDAAAAAAAVAAVDHHGHAVADDNDKGLDSTKGEAGEISLDTRTTRSGRGPSSNRQTLSQSIQAGHHVSK